MRNQPLSKERENEITWIGDTQSPANIGAFFTATDARDSVFFYYATLGRPAV